MPPNLKYKVNKLKDTQKYSLKSKKPHEKSIDTDDDYSPPPKKSKSAVKTGTSNSKPKLPGPSKEQKKAMLEFMLKHKHYATGRIPGKNANQAMKVMHERLALTLNNLPGTPRDGGKWWKCWVSIRNSNKAYAAANYKVRDFRTGGGAPNESVSSVDALDTNTSKEETYYTDCETANTVMKIIGWHNALGIEGVKDDLDDTGHREEVIDGEQVTDGEEVVLDGNDDEEQTEIEKGLSQDLEKTIDQSFDLVTSTPSGKDRKSNGSMPDGFKISKIDSISLGSNTSSSRKDRKSNGSMPDGDGFKISKIDSISLGSNTSSSRSNLFPEKTEQLLANLSSEKQSNTAAVEKKLDIVIEELKKNTNAVSLLMQYLKENSIMVLSAPSAVPSNVVISSKESESAVVGVEDAVVGVGVDDVICNEENGSAVVDNELSKSVVIGFPELGKESGSKEDDGGWKDLLNFLDTIPLENTSAPVQGHHPLSMPDI